MLRSIYNNIYNNIFKKSINDISFNNVVNNNNDNLDNIINMHIEKVINNIEYLNELETFENFNKELFYDKLIQKYPVAIKYINKKYHTLKMCEYAVNKIPDLIKFTAYQTIEMCKKIVNKKPSLIKYCLYQTDDMVNKAIHYDYKLIEFITNHNINICTYVVKRDPYYFKFIKIQNIYLCKLACNIYPEYIAYCNTYDEELCINVLKKNPYLIKYIDKNKQTKEINYINVNLLIKLDINTLYDFNYNPHNFKIIDVCSICLDDFLINQKITNTLCNHYYHKLCLDLWLKNSKNCPLCNNKLI